MGTPQRSSKRSCNPAWDIACEINSEAISGYFFLSAGTARNGSRYSRADLITSRPVGLISQEMLIPQSKGVYELVELSGVHVPPRERRRLEKSANNLARLASLRRGV